MYVLLAAVLLSVLTVRKKPHKRTRYSQSDVFCLYRRSSSMVCLSSAGWWWWLVVVVGGGDDDAGAGVVVNN